MLLNYCENNLIQRIVAQSVRLALTQKPTVVNASFRFHCNPRLLTYFNGTGSTINIGLFDECLLGIFK